MTRGIHKKELRKINYFSQQQQYQYNKKQYPKQNGRENSQRHFNRQIYEIVHKFTRTLLKSENIIRETDLFLITAPNNGKRTYYTLAKKYNMKQNGMF